MLTVSLHGINIHAPHGLYPEEHILGNAFVIDVDLWLPDVHPWPFAWRSGTIYILQFTLHVHKKAHKITVGEIGT